MIHICWSCPMIQPFWHMVHDTISSVTLEEMNFTPTQYLLHHSKTSRKLYLKSLPMFMTSAARHCIPYHWRSTNIPFKREQYHRINHIEKIEELISISQENISKYTSTWYNWIQFKNSKAYEATTQLDKEKKQVRDKMIIVGKKETRGYLHPQPPLFFLSSFSPPLKLISIHQKQIKRKYYTITFIL